MIDRDDDSFTPIAAKAAILNHCHATSRLAQTFTSMIVAAIEGGAPTEIEAAIRSAEQDILAIYARLRVEVEGWDTRGSGAHP